MSPRGAAPVGDACARLVADAAVSAPGPGLASAALPAIASRPGIATAAGLTPTTVFMPYPGNADNLAEAVTPGPLAAVLNLKVISGTLARFGPGDIAPSKTITGTNAVTAKVGDTITAYLADHEPGPVGSAQREHVACGQAACPQPRSHPPDLRVQLLVGQGTAGGRVEDGRGGTSGVGVFEDEPGRR